MSTEQERVTKNQRGTVTEAPRATDPEGAEASDRLLRRKGDPWAEMMRWRRRIMRWRL